MNWIFIWHRWEGKHLWAKISISYLWKDTLIWLNSTAELDQSAKHSFVAWFEQKKWNLWYYHWVTGPVCSLTFFFLLPLSHKIWVITNSWKEMQLISQARVLFFCSVCDILNKCLHVTWKRSSMNWGGTLGNCRFITRISE